MRLSISFLLASSILIACSADSRDPGAEQTSSELRLPLASEVLGAIDYGQTVDVAYTETPSYRAFKLAGKQGDTVDLWVRSPSGGDARAWILRESGRTLARNDDADGSTLDSHITVELPRTETYYVVFRDADYEDNDFTVTLGGGGGAGSAIPASLIGKTITADATCGFLIEWATFNSRTVTCPDYGYGWNEPTPVSLTFRVEGTAAAPVLVAEKYEIEKQVATWGEKRKVGWPETKIALDPATGKGKLENRSNYDRPPGPNSYCYGVAKGIVRYDASLTGDQLKFEMFENMQTNSCCSSKVRRATCTLSVP